MKYFFVILLILSFEQFAQAQYLNGAENNFYEYGEKDGFIHPINGIVKQYKDGSILGTQYANAPLLIGNNYYSSIPFFDNRKISGFEISIKNSQPDTFWIVINKKAYLFAQKQLIDSVVCNDYIVNIMYINNNLSYFTYTQDGNWEYLGFGIKQNEKVIHFGKSNFVKSDFPYFFKLHNIYYIAGKSGYCVVNSQGIGAKQNYKNLLAQNLAFIGQDNDTVAIAFNRNTQQFYTTTNLINFSLLAPQQGNLQQINSQGLISKNYGESKLVYSVFGRNTPVACSFKECITGTFPQTTLQFSYPNDIIFTTPATQNSCFIATKNRSLRVFEHIKKFPKLFNNSNSNLIFSVSQDNKGRIWAGSYNGGIAIIDSHKTIYKPTPKLAITNGACAVGNNQILISEGGYGLLNCNLNGSYKQILKGFTGFILYPDTSTQTLYYGTHFKGLYFTKFNDLDKSTINWQIVDTKQGLTLPNILTITKDKKDRIWLGHSSRGWAVYYPKQNKATTFLIEKSQTNFGTMSSCTDTKGTVWLGSKQQGLLYYNNYTSDTVNPKDIKAITHPLLPKGKTITSMVKNGNWLIMGVTNYYVAFDLATWYATGKVLVKYLNPQEANLTAETEQNTLLVDKRDSSVWFSTNNMLYQWDFKTWLHLPTYNATPNVDIQYGNNDTHTHINNTLYLKPTQNSIALKVWFQTIDNMPRYMATAFGKVDDSLVFSNIGLQSQFTYNNLASGNYVFKVLICQTDGSVTYSNFYITINKFWWQHWWVWLLGCLLILSPLIIWLNAKRKQANLIAEKEEQKKQLANLQVVTLSNQFRPHFILNALNAIGTQLQGKPKAESVLSRLGESVNIIFNHSLSHKSTQPLVNEWKLVTNIIQLHKLMYLQNFEFTQPREEQLKQIETLELPMGILQIPVENALLHGLGNKINATNLQLNININESQDYYTFIILDNGIGRTKAQQLSNFTKHGLGTKNLLAIIEMLNRNNTNKILFEYEDDIYNDNENMYGTKVIISIPKRFKYE
ncbi:MAG: histidine kinase [Chitinophagaceae bacterium]